MGFRSHGCASLSCSCTAASISYVIDAPVSKRSGATAWRGQRLSPARPSLPSSSADALSPETSLPGWGALLQTVLARGRRGDVAPQRAADHLCPVEPDRARRV